MPSRIDTLIAKCASWDDFVLLVNNQQDNKFKGDLFERLTQVFLQTSSTYVSKLKNVWRCNNNELPENIRKKLRLPIADEGIDLICETLEGEFWSVQCKYKANQNQPLTHKELSTFTSLSFNTATDIVLGLVVHTSTKKVRKSNLMTNVTELGLEKWLEISKEEWKRIRTVCRSNKLLPPKKRQPRKHQKAAIKDAVHHYSALSKSRGKLIMPCGTGKSLTAFWIAQALEAKSIIVAVPSLTLVRDSLADWTAEFLSHGIKPNWIAVCSDNTVGATADADSTVATVYETGIPTTTDKQETQKFLKRKSNSPKIVFTTYQSGQKLCDAKNGSSIKFDLLICDEAHKTVGSSNKAFATLLFDENINAKHRIFMTATERIYRQSKDDVVSMDDPNVYGEVFHELSFKEAIKQKIICDYKILTVAVTANEAKALINSNQALRVADGKDSFETDAHNLMVGLTLQRVFERYQIKHAVTFHRSIKRAKFFSDQQDNFSSRSGIKNYHVSSKYSAGERAKMLKQFANDNLSLISNARCLTEGVDIPAIDCVVFADPKHSTVDIVQAAGRAMRQSKETGKKFGYILLPLIIPEDKDLIEFGSRTDFSEVVRVIATLSISDERIADELQHNVNNPLKKRKSIIEIDDEYLNFLNIDPDKFYMALSTKVWRSVRKATAIKLSIEQIINWIKHHFYSTGKYPESQSGSVIGQTDEDWGLINTCLQQGRRGLPGGTTIRKLVIEKFTGKDLGIVNNQSNLVSKQDISNHYNITSIAKYVEQGLIVSTGKSLRKSGQVVDLFKKEDLARALRELEINLFFSDTHASCSELGFELLDRDEYVTQSEASSLIGKAAWLFEKSGRLRLAGKGYKKGGVSKFFLLREVESIMKEEATQASDMLTSQEIKRRFRIFKIKSLIEKGDLKPDGFYFRGSERFPLFKEKQVQAYVDKNDMYDISDLLTISKLAKETNRSIHWIKETIAELGIEPTFSRLNKTGTTKYFQKDTLSTLNELAKRD